MYLGIHLISSNMAPIASVSEEYSTLGIRRIAISSLKYGIPIWEIDDGKVWRLQSFSFSVKQLSTWHRMGRKCGVCVYGLAMDRLWKSSSTLMSVNNGWGPVYTDTHPKSDGRERPGAAGASTTATGSYVSTYQARPRTNFRLVFFSIGIAIIITCAYAHMIIPLCMSTTHHIYHMRICAYDHMRVHSTHGSYLLNKASFVPR